MDGIILIFRRDEFQHNKISDFVLWYISFLGDNIYVEGRKNGNQGLEIAPPFYIYNENGEYSEQMKEVYYG